MSAPFSWARPLHLSVGLTDRTAIIFGFAPSSDATPPTHSV